MKSRDNRLEGTAGLYRQAREVALARLSLSPENFESPSSEAQRVIQELQLAQIELEIQNEELLRTQLELEAARTRYFDLYDQAPVGYCTVSEKGLILENNLTAAKLLVMTREALLKQPITRFIHKKDQDVYYFHRKQLADASLPHACDLRMVKSDGTPFWAHLTSSAVRVANGSFLNRVMINDITEQKLAGEALRKSEERH